jgi:hypothetical protein
MLVLTIPIAIGLATYLILVVLDQLREDLLDQLDGDAVPREKHNSRVLELLNANNRDLEKRRRIAAAARDLLRAQLVHAPTIDPRVAYAAEALDRVLAERVSRSHHQARAVANASIPSTRWKWETASLYRCPVKLDQVVATEWYACSLALVIGGEKHMGRRFAFALSASKA